VALTTPTVGGWPAISGHLLTKDEARRKPHVLYDEAGILLFNRPGRREAARPQSFLVPIVAMMVPVVAVMVAATFQFYLPSIQAAAQSLDVRVSNAPVHAKDEIEGGIVRCSLVRTSPFLGRPALTVRFSVVGVTKRRRGLVMRNPPLTCLTVQYMSIL
jgi:hypothetical protein